MQDTLDYAQLLASRAPLPQRFAKEVTRRAIGLFLDEPCAWSLALSVMLGLRTTYGKGLLLSEKSDRLSSRVDEFGSPNSEAQPHD